MHLFFRKRIKAAQTSLVSTQLDLLTIFFLYKFVEDDCTSTCMAPISTSFGHAIRPTFVVVCLAVKLLPAPPSLAMLLGMKACAAIIYVFSSHGCLLCESFAVLLQMVGQTTKNARSILRVDVCNVHVKNGRCLLLRWLQSGMRRPDRFFMFVFR